MKSTMTLLSVLLLLLVTCQTNVTFAQEQKEKVSVPQMDLNAAIYLKDFTTIKRHIEAGSNLNSPGPTFGSSPLISAAFLDVPEAAKLLIDAEVNLNFKKQYGATALHTTATFGKTGIANMQSINTGNDLYKVFEKYNVKGCFILENIRDNTRIVVNEARTDSGFLPASTFKVPHALIALETGVVPDGDYLIDWDGVNRSIKAWNRSHTLISAIQNSVVWYFKEIAGRIGKEKLYEWLVKLDYGNKDVTGEDPFWLAGNLRVTPNQQLTFMKNFYNEIYPFQQKFYTIVKNAILLDSKDDYTFYGKTGWTDVNNINTGWLFGYIETAEGTYIFVTNVESGLDNEKFGESRFLITKELLKKLNVITNE
jgi:beta-lactamase class D